MEVANKFLPVFLSTSTFLYVSSYKNYLKNVSLSKIFINWLEFSGALAPGSLWLVVILQKDGFEVDDHAIVIDQCHTSSAFADPRTSVPHLRYQLQGWGPRYPPEIPPHGGGWGGEMDIQNPGDLKKIHGPGFFGGIVYWYDVWQ